MQSKTEWMELALQLAKATEGQTSPNPSVGAVVVKDGIILGMGSHLQAGEAHAEVHAINQAGDKAKGAEIYVTLEPCAHFGKTPPCANLIVESGIKKVYIACVDPNPQVAGKGIKILEQAGIEVEVGIKETQAILLNRKFFHYMEKKRPYVTLKAAMTLDGKTATSTGDSKWITSKEAREMVHQSRHQHDAILVGKETVLKDDPQLTTRLPQGGKNPIRIILDTHLTIKGDYQIFSRDVPTWIVCTQEADVKGHKELYPHVEFIQLPTKTIELADLLAILGERQIQSLYVEGGQTVHASFLKEQLADEYHWYIAPKLLGGQDARSVIGGISPLKMDEATDLDISEIKEVGQDILVVARPKKGEV
ncbi:bifunctional diaminohydroxyphosphoribosylaminopyrimidine deaminase/5-amino-6-(5-phosphoribosylamino)uracil reductase RibD [Saliterribacillus persicus]|uniref:Riboflavin biosynthesis protein RibD n=1 Tax=Saliterribacillus persicus TaxID=930114 RepID=A0A368Y4C2_9BACI|nr:bifunctional diaminohydroxyphosphoribosylaminopyrimidine deaminase/5-amino-6-(5-phosphoribosylamino)uracil reductase RibD [Saliterribacillus persicus]RCW73074.1 diaminohydroxyphosphoribosylaminopyrimidine deaminase /5-amino-6-(5-phosphoribosylamino)uracil reductase [Saliterribacillus persicus]